MNRRNGTHDLGQALKDSQPIPMPPPFSGLTGVEVIIFHEKFVQWYHHKEKKRKEKTTQTKSAWVKEVWMPQNLWEAVGPHYRGGGSAPFGDFSANSCFVGSLPFLA